MPKWSVDEKEDLQNLLIEKSRNARKSLNIRELSKEFIKRNREKRSLNAVEDRIYKFRDGIHLMKNIDVETKETLMMALRKPGGMLSHVPWTDEEITDLVEFVLGESKKSGRFCAAKLSRDYAESDRTTRSQSSVEKKIFLLRQKFKTIGETDKETLISALRNSKILNTEDVSLLLSHRWSIPELNDLDAFLLERVRKPLSNIQIAKEYHKTGGTKRPLTVVCAKIAAIRKRMEAKSRTAFPDIIEQILDFLAQYCKGRVEPISDFDFVQRCVVRFSYASRYQQYLSTQYRNAKNRIALSEDYEEIERVKMLFVSGTPVGPGLLHDFRKSAFVELDEHNLISRYKSNDGKLVLNRNPDDTEESLIFPKTEDTSPESSGIPKTEEDVEQEVVEPVEVKTEEPEI